MPQDPNAEVAGAVPSKLWDLRDVAADAPAVGDALVWDGTEWAPAAATPAAEDHYSWAGNGYPPTNIVLADASSSIIDERIINYEFLADGDLVTFDDATGAMTAHRAGPYEWYALVDAVLGAAVDAPNKYLSVGLEQTPGPDAWYNANRILLAAGTTQWIGRTGGVVWLLEDQIVELIVTNMTGKTVTIDDAEFGLRYIG